MTEPATFGKLMSAVDDYATWAAVTRLQIKPFPMAEGEPMHRARLAVERAARELVLRAQAAMPCYWHSEACSHPHGATGDCRTFKGTVNPCPSCLARIAEQQLHELEQQED